MKALSEDHRLTIVRLCPEGPDVESGAQDGSAEEQRIEGMNTQGQVCVRDEEEGFSKNVTRRCRVECVGDQVSADDRRMLQTSCAHRLVHDRNSIPEDSGGRNTRHESVAQTREQLKE